MNLFLFTLFFFYYSNFCVLVADGLRCNEEKLREEIFSRRKVTNHTRPVQNHNDTIDVSVFLSVDHINYFDVQTEVFSFNAFLDYSWSDLTLAWEEKDFPDCHFIYVDPYAIWHPDILVLNKADFSEVTAINAEATPRISKDGSVLWLSAENVKSICPVDLRAYPFDEHTCKVIYIIWSYSGQEVNVFKHMFIAMNKQFAEFQEWEVTSYSGNVTDFFYGEDLYYQEATFYFTLKRRASYYNLVLIVPIEIAILVLLLIFWLSPSNSKILVSGVVTLIFTILVIHLHWLVPHNGSNVPSIVSFCTYSLLLAGLAFVQSVAITAIYSSPPTSHPPSWVENVLSSWLGTVLRIHVKQEVVGTSLFSQGMKSPHAVMWQFIAIAVDRICFLLFCIIFCIILLFLYV